MAKLGSVSAKGKSGTSYTFGVYELGTRFKAIAGTYIYAKRYKKGNKYEYSAIYIGHTENLSTRFNDHHKKECIESNDANCICVRSAKTKESAKIVEQDLLGAINTPCNDNKS